MDVNSATLELLRRADDPIQCEQPSGFDGNAAMARIRKLKPKLQEIVGLPLDSDENVQDASYFTELSLSKPSERSNDTDVIIGIRFSAFGNLFSIWSSDSSESLDPAKLKRVIDTIEQYGLKYVDPGSLAEPYTGANEVFKGETWWRRFFDYV